MGVLLIALGMVLFFPGCGRTIGSLPLTISPPSATVSTGKTQQFQITVDGNPYSIDLSWAVNGISGGNATVGTISSTGLYTAPSVIPNPATVTVAASQQGTNNQGSQVSASITAQVMITGNPGTGGGGGGGSTPTAMANVSPSSIAPGGQATLSWSSSNADNCIISDGNPDHNITQQPTGSEPVAPTATTTYTVTCVGANGSATAQATLTVQVTDSGIGVTLTPSTGTLASGQSMQFTAAVSNDSSGQGVTWSATVGNAPAPSFASSLTATYTAPIVMNNTTVTITATSKADPTASASATITVTPQQTNGGSCTGNGAGSPFISISPDSPSIQFGASQLLTATIMANGVTDNSIRWVLQPGEGVSTANEGTLTPQTSNTALYQATATVFSTVTVTATSVQCPDVIGKATIQIGAQ